MKTHAWICDGDYTPWIVFVEGHVSEKQAGITKSVAVRLFSEFGEDIEDDAKNYFNEAQFSQFYIKSNDGLKILDEGIWKISEGSAENNVPVTGYKFNI